MAVLPNPRDKKEYLKQQSEKLKRDAEKQRKADNYPEANRLDKLSQEAEKSSEALEEQLRNAGK